MAPKPEKIWIWTEEVNQIGHKKEINYVMIIPLERSNSVMAMRTPPTIGRESLIKLVERYAVDNLWDALKRVGIQFGQIINPATLRHPGANCNRLFTLKELVAAINGGVCDYNKLEPQPRFSDLRKFFEGSKIEVIPPLNR